MRGLNLSIVGSFACLALTACGPAFTYAGADDADAGDMSDALGVALDSDNMLDAPHNSDASDAGVVTLDGSADDADGASTCDAGTAASMCNGTWFSPPSKYCNELDAIEYVPPQCAGCNYTCDCLKAATTCAPGTTPTCGIGIEGSGGDGISIRCPVE